MGFITWFLCSSDQKESHLYMTVHTNYLRQRARILFSILPKYHHLPHTLSTYLFPPSSISDCFVWTANVESITYKCENLPLYLARDPLNPGTMNHTFSIFTQSGSLWKTVSTETTGLFVDYNFEPPIDTGEYGMFLHHSSLSGCDLPSSSQNNVSSLTLQSRGYTSYKSSSASAQPSVHGNFGGITPRLSPTAAKRLPHAYTPRYQFLPDYFYDLVFVNPLAERLSLKVSFHNASPPFAAVLGPFQTLPVPVSCFSGQLTIVSRLPMLRPLVFRYSSPLKIALLDVFHT